MTEKVTIEIDGRACEALPGEMIIEVADREGIAIPRFCYHKKLSIAANCRMCLVEAEQGGRPFPKPVPACATPVGDGMRVQTRSPRAIEAQKGTMEFLLINHPLDCPICDQGGECELQDVAMGYGSDVSRYTERKRVVKDEDLGPLIATDMTRCIHCTRCVRFGAEIAGVRELGATGRGEDMRIGTFVEHTVDHELSGNIIDLCPVGALTSKPFRFKARSWELTQADGIAPHDGVGSNIHMHLRGDQVMRVHPRENETVNETWISDRDRFSYQGLAAEDRLTEPLVKRDGAWQPIPWQEALELAAHRLKQAGTGLGALIAPTSTLEEMYLAQKLVRGLGSRDIDSRLRQQDFRGDAADPLLPWLGVPIAEVEHQAGFLLVGSDIRQEQPLLAHRIRKAVMRGAHAAAVNPYQLSLTFPAAQFVDTPSGMLLDLAAIAKCLKKRGSGTVKDLIAKAEPDTHHADTAARLKEAGKGRRGLILIGALAAAHPDYTLVKALAAVIAEASKCRFGFLPASANSVGAHLAGALPHVLPGAAPADPPGADTLAMLAQPRRGYLLWGLEPAYDLNDPAAAAAAFEQADFVVACTAYRAPSVQAAAHLMLPVAGFAESSGTLVNAGATWQGFRGAVAPPGEARPGWKVLRVLGNLLALEGFDYVSSSQVRDEVRAASGTITPGNQPRGDLKTVPLTSASQGLCRIGNVPMYAVDPLVRRAHALQRTPSAGGFGVFLNPAEAAAIGVVDGDQVLVKQGGSAVLARVFPDAAVPTGCARIPAAVPGSETLGTQMGPVGLEKV
jgi:NADH-quinone oxidoreductase subunit G